MKDLSSQIDKVIDTEKTLLKNEIKAIEKRYNNDEITFEEAEEQKKAASTLHANNIKNKVASIEEQVHNLVQGKVTNKLTNNKDNYKHNSIVKDFGFTSDSTYYKRTSPYFVLSLGVSNMIDGGNFNKNLKWNSGFAELGINYKTRIFKKSSLLYINYGLSYRENNYKPKDNQYFVTSGNNTSLTTHTSELKRSKFTTSQLVVPVFFEMDFSKPKIKNGKKYFRKNAAFRFGLGGFAGFNIGSKQYIKYKADGKKVKITSKGNYNVNDFVYGIQALIGYRDTSFYVKYDMQDVFTNSFTNQKNISFGVRFDL